MSDMVIDQQPRIFSFSFSLSVSFRRYSCRIGCFCYIRSENEIVTVTETEKIWERSNKEHLKGLVQQRLLFVEYLIFIGKVSGLGYYKWKNKH